MFVVFFSFLLMPYVALLTTSLSYSIVMTGCWGQMRHSPSPKSTFHHMPQKASLKWITEVYLELEPSLTHLYIRNVWKSVFSQMQKNGYSSHISPSQLQRDAGLSCILSFKRVFSRCFSSQLLLESGEEGIICQSLAYLNFFPSMSFMRQIRGAGCRSHVILWMCI